MKMYLEDYIKGVLAAEMPAEFDIEALKAQAVLPEHMHWEGRPSCMVQGVYMMMQMYALTIHIVKRG